MSNHSMRGRGWLRGDNLLASRDHDRLRHALIEWDESVAGLAVRPGVVKDANDRRIAALYDAGNASEPPPVRSWRGEFNQYLIALHGAVDLIGRNEHIVFFSCALTRVRTNESIAIAMKVKAARKKVVTRRAASFLGKAPMFTVCFDEIAARGHASQLLKEQTPLASSAKPELPDQLLVTGLASSGSSDLGQQFAIVHTSRVLQRRIAPIQH